MPIDEEDEDKVDPSWIDKPLTNRAAGKLGRGVKRGTRDEEDLRALIERKQFAQQAQEEFKDSGFWHSLDRAVAEPLSGQAVALLERVTGHGDRADSTMRWAEAQGGAAAGRASEVAQDVGVPAQVIDPVISALQSAPLSVPAVLGGPVGLAATAAAITTTSTQSAYVDRKDSGQRGNVLAGNAALSGASDATAMMIFQALKIPGIEGMLGRTTKEAAAKSIGQGLKDVGKRVLGAFGQELPEELTAEVLQTMFAEMDGTSKEELTPRAILEKTRDVAASTFAMTLGFSAITEGAKLYQDQKAKKDREKALKEMAATSIDPNGPLPDPAAPPVDTVPPPVDPNQPPGPPPAPAGSEAVPPTVPGEPPVAPAPPATGKRFPMPMQTQTIDGILADGKPRTLEEIGIEIARLGMDPASFVDGIAGVAKQAVIGGRYESTKDGRVYLSTPEDAEVDAEVDTESPVPVPVPAETTELEPPGPQETPENPAIPPTVGTAPVSDSVPAETAGPDLSSYLSVMDTDDVFTSWSNNPSDPDERPRFNERVRHYANQVVKLTRNQGPLSADQIYADLLTDKMFANRKVKQAASESLAKLSADVASAAATPQVTPQVDDTGKGSTAAAINHVENLAAIANIKSLEALDQWVASNQEAVATGRLDIAIEQRRNLISPPTPSPSKAGVGPAFGGTAPKVAPEVTPEVTPEVSPAPVRLGQAPPPKAEKPHGKTYDVDGIGFDSFTKAVEHAKSVGKGVNLSDTGEQKWTPAPAVDPKKQRQYEDRKRAYDAQVRLDEQQKAEREAGNKSEGPAAPSRTAWADSKADAFEAQAQQLEGGRGTAVGAAEINDRIKADALRSFSRKVQGGMDPAEAATMVKAEARGWVAKHNARRPKDVNWKRFEGIADYVIDDAVKQTPAIPKPEAKPAPTPVSLGKPAKPVAASEDAPTEGLVAKAARAMWDAPDFAKPIDPATLLKKSGRHLSLIDRASGDQAIASFVTDPEGVVLATQGRKYTPGEIALNERLIENLFSNGVGSVYIGVPQASTPQLIEALSDRGYSIEKNDGKGHKYRIDPKQAVSLGKPKAAKPDAPWAKSTTEDESRWFGTEVSVEPGSKNEDQYDGKVVRVLNGGDVVEVQPQGQDGTFRVPSARVAVKKVVDSKAEPELTEMTAEDEEHLFGKKPEPKQPKTFEDLKSLTFDDIADGEETEGVARNRGKTYRAKKFKVTDADGKEIEAKVRIDSDGEVQVMDLGRTKEQREKDSAAWKKRVQTLRDRIEQVPFTHGEPPHGTGKGRTIVQVMKAAMEKQSGPALAGAAREHGLLTDGHVLVRLSDKDRAKAAAAKVGIPADYPAMAKKTLEDFMVMPGYAEAAKIVAYRETFGEAEYEAAGTTKEKSGEIEAKYILGGTGGTQWVVEAHYHETVMKMHPKAIPHVVRQKGKNPPPVFYRVGDETVGVVMPIDYDVPFLQFKESAVEPAAEAETESDSDTPSEADLDKMADEMWSDDDVDSTPPPPPAPPKAKPEPAKPSKRIFAVMTSDGKIHADPKASMHYDVVQNAGLESWDIIDGGFIVDGKYLMSLSDGGYAAMEGEPEQLSEVQRYTDEYNAKAKETAPPRAKISPKAPRADGAGNPSAKDKAKAAESTAEALLDELVSKARGRLGMGVDPEMASIAIRYVKAKIEAGTYRFVDFAEHVLASAPREVIDRLRPYLEMAWKVAHGEGLTEDSGGDLASYGGKRRERFRPVGATNNRDFANRPTDEAAKAALDTGKRDRFGAARSLNPGQTVALRIDIPAFLNHGTYVVSIHEDKGTAGNQVGSVAGYDTAARLSGSVRFSVQENAAGRIAEGKNKHPIATVKGKFDPSRDTPDDIENWHAIGMNPAKAPFFYDKKTGQEVSLANDAISIGNTVFVREIVEYGNRNAGNMPIPDVGFHSMLEAIPEGIRANIQKQGRESLLKDARHDVIAGNSLRRAMENVIDGKRPGPDANITEHERHLKAWLLLNEVNEAEPSQVTMYRGDRTITAGVDNRNVRVGDEILIGGKKANNGITANLKVAKKFADGVLYEIEPGVKAARVSTAEPQEFTGSVTGENEFIAAGTFTVTGIKEVGDNTVIQVKQSSSPNVSLGTLDRMTAEARREVSRLLKELSAASKRSMSSTLPDPELMGIAINLAKAMIKERGLTFAGFVQGVYDKAGMELTQKLGVYLEAAWRRAIKLGLTTDPVGKTSDILFAQSPKVDQKGKQGDPQTRLATKVRDALEAGTAMTSGSFFAMANEEFGGSRAGGDYGDSEATDALELGVNLYLQGKTDPNVTADEAKETVRRIQEIMELVPRQRGRTGEKSSMQQFSTPPAYAYVTAWIANPTKGDVVLEPSGGMGGIAVHAANSGATVYVNELSESRAEGLQQLDLEGVFTEDAEQIGAILADKMPPPTVVLMNPPFSRAGKRMGDTMIQGTDRKHIAEVMALVPEGGRVVAIVSAGLHKQSDGMTRWLADMPHRVTANIEVARDVYRGYGTEFPTRVLVIDKVPRGDSKTINQTATDLFDLIDKAQEARDARPATERAPAQPDRETTSDEDGRGDQPGDNARDPVPDDVPRDPSGETGPDREDVGGGRDDNRSGSDDANDAPPAAGGNARVQMGGRKSGRAPRKSGGGGGGKRTRGSVPGPSRKSGGVPRTGVTKAKAVTQPRPASKASALTESTFEDYTPSVVVAGAKKHPAPIVESAAMAAVSSPKINYEVDVAPGVFEGYVTEDGAYVGLSDIQLEAIALAGHAHSQMLPSGERRGFLIGDGTGVGKAREALGIINDDFIKRGDKRRKAVFVTKNDALIGDAVAEWVGVGGDPADFHPMSSFQNGSKIELESGIVALGYDTLGTGASKTAKDKGNTMSRLEQIVDWVGKDFDGVVIFDESHMMGNSLDSGDGQTAKSAAQRALAAVDLQKQLPNARVVYLSATAATEVVNLAYADRLGLWGQGTQFADKRTFISEIEAGGVAAMEKVAADMKAMGMYVARNLSFDDGTPEGRVEFDRVRHELTADQERIYDKLSEAWIKVLERIDAALDLTENTKGRKWIISAFWGANQRFWNDVITGMTAPALIKGIEKDLAEGRSVLVQLTATHGAATERAIAGRKDDQEFEDLDISPRRGLMQLIEKSFPTQRHEKYTDDNGNTRERPVVDAAGKPVHDPQAVAMKNKLLQEVGSLEVASRSPIDMIIDHFGEEMVAEISGRNKRLTYDGDKKLMEQRRSKGAVKKDRNAFMRGDKRILIFSEAGGTGTSYHASLSHKNQQRRSHYLWQAGWKAPTAIQGLGRGHRSNQASAPLIHLIEPGLEGYKRFISTIARRLGQLGALTKGQRDAGDGGLFNAKDNLESTEAVRALSQFLTDANRGNIEGIDRAFLMTRMGFDNLPPGVIGPDAVNMTSFLNRLLNLPPKQQATVFSEFSNRLDTIVEKAIQDGTLDQGMETVKAEKIVKASEQTVYEHPTGAQTKWVQLTLTKKTSPLSYEGAIRTAATFTGTLHSFVRSKTTGKVFMVIDRNLVTQTKDGKVTHDATFVGVLGRSYGHNLEQLDNAKYWETLPRGDVKSPLDAKNAWDAEFNAAPKEIDETLNLLTGALLPVWKKVIGGHSVVRALTQDGETILGRIMDDRYIDRTLQNFGVRRDGEAALQYSPKEAMQAAYEGGIVTLNNGWTVKKRKIDGEDNIEIHGADYSSKQLIENAGGFQRMIDYKTRFFIPFGDTQGQTLSNLADSFAIESVTLPQGVSRASLGPAAKTPPTPPSPPTPPTPKPPAESGMAKQIRQGDVIPPAKDSAVPPPPGVDAFIAPDNDKTGSLSSAKRQVLSATDLIDDYAVESEDVNTHVGPDKALEKFWESARRGLSRKRMWERIKETWEATPDFIARNFGRGGMEHLPRTKQFGEGRSLLRVWKDAVEIAKWKTGELLRRTTGGLSAADYDLFSRAVIFRNFRNREGALPFELDRPRAEAELARIEAKVLKNPKVQAALEFREKWHGEMKEAYIYWHQQIGIDMTDRLKKEDYFHHQVLWHYRMKEPTTGSSKDAQVDMQRGWLRHETGSPLAINANYVQAEWEVATQMIADTIRAEALAKLTTEYDTMPELERKAKIKNMHLLYGGKKQYEHVLYLREMRAQADPEDRKIWSQQLRDLDPLFGFRQDIAIKSNAILNEEPWLAALPSASFFKELRRISVDPKDPSAEMANGLLGAIKRQEIFIEESIGKKNYQTWRTVMPDTHRSAAIRPGRALYQAYTIPEQLANELMANHAAVVGIQADVLREVLVMGHEYTPIVVPKEIAAQMEEMSKIQSNSLAAVVGGWWRRNVTFNFKRFALLSPERFVKYNLRSLSEIDKVVNLMPKAASVPLMIQAGKELFAVYRQHDKITPEVRLWMELGGAQSLHLPNEMGDLSALKEFERFFEDESGWDKVPGKLWAGYWRKAGALSNYRESILRYSAFLAYRKELKENGGKPISYGGSNPAEIDGIRDIDRKAMRLSADLLGDYGDLSPAGAMLRDAAFGLPFVSFTELNFRTYMRGIANLANHEQSATAAGRTLAKALGVTAVAQSPYLAYRLGRIYLLAFGAQAVLTTINNLAFADEEDELPDEIKDRPHLTLGRNADGSVRYFDRLGTSTDFMDWLGLDSLDKMAMQVATGRMTLSDVAKEMVMSPTNKFVQSLSPAVKVPMGWMTGKDTFPDVRKSRTIRDMGEFTFQAAGLGNTYKIVMGRPNKGAGEWLQSLAWSTISSGSAAYFRTRDEIQRVTQRGGMSRDSITPRDEALYYYKQALRFGDTSAAKKYEADYKAAGGTDKTIMQSLKMLHPLGTLSLPNEIRFRATLDARGEEELAKAEAYFYRDLVTPEQAEEIKAHRENRVKDLAKTVMTHAGRPNPDTNSDYETAATKYEADYADLKAWLDENRDKPDVRLAVRGVLRSDRFQTIEEGNTTPQGVNESGRHYQERVRRAAQDSANAKRWRKWFLDTQPKALN